MTNVDNSSSDRTRTNDQQFLKNSLETSRHLPQKDIEDCLPNSDRAKILSRIQPYARQQLAETRTEEMKQVLQHQWSDGAKTLATVLVAAVSAGIFGAAGQIFTFRLPSWLAIPASGAGGILIGVVAEDRTKRVITTSRLKHSTQNLHDELEKNQQAAKNEFDYEHYKTQLVLLQTIEGKKYLKRQSLADPVVASSLILLEAAAAFYLALPAGLVFALLAGGVPLVVILAASAALSQYIELPKEATKLIPEYNRHLYPWNNLSEEEILEIRRTFCAIKFILESTRGSRLKNRAMAEADADMDFWSQNLRMEQERLLEAVYQCQEKYEAAKKNLDAQAMPPVDRKGIGGEEFIELQTEAEREWKAKMEQEKENLETKKQAELAQIRDTFSLEISRCQQEWERAKELYEAAQMQWQTDKGYSGTTLKS